jgi:membrane-bound lytic murein transglycosylase A
MTVRVPRMGVGFAGLLLVALLLPTTTGCKKNKPAAVNFSQELPPGKLALRKIRPEEYPDFAKSTWNLNVMGQSVDASLQYMAHPSSERHFPYLDITHERAVASLRAFREMIDKAYAQGGAAGDYVNSDIRARFEVYKSIGAPNPQGGYTDRVLFTGYCTPIYDASLTRTGEYQWPLYRRPKDLATDPVTGETSGRKNPDGSVTPYYARGEIEGQNVLAGQEFVWLKSRWEAYVVTIQGSARLRLTDGRIYEIGYAGHNGHEYSSPGKQLVADGVITPEQLNIKTLGAYFAANPAAADKYLWLNKRTVFFTERRGGPFGSLNVPVTTFASIATDKEVYPRAMPAFLNVPVPRTDNPNTTWNFSGFMMDQDTGGAIRASGRCDIFMGIGPDGEQLAGHQLHEGELYYVALKPEYVSQYANPLPAEQLVGTPTN